LRILIQDNQPTYEAVEQAYNLGYTDGYNQALREVVNKKEEEQAEVRKEEIRVVKEALRKYWPEAAEFGTWDDEQNEPKYQR
jgi:hypothetical protein